MTIQNVYNDTGAEGNTTSKATLVRQLDEVEAFINATRLKLARYECEMSGDEIRDDNEELEYLEEERYNIASELLHLHDYGFSELYSSGVKRGVAV